MAMGGADFGLMVRAAYGFPLKGKAAKGWFGNSKLVPKLPKVKKNNWSKKPNLRYANRPPMGY